MLDHGSQPFAPWSRSLDHGSQSLDPRAGYSLQGASHRLLGASCSTTGASHPLPGASHSLPGASHRLQRVFGPFLSGCAAGKLTGGVTALRDRCAEVRPRMLATAPVFLRRLALGDTVSGLLKSASRLAAGRGSLRA